MNIKLIALDIDGTLINSQGEITPLTRYVLEEASKKGVLITIASGRTRGAMSAILPQMPPPDYLIQSNGANIVDMDTGRIIYNQFLPWSRVPEILELLAYYNVGFHCFIGSEGYMDTLTLEKYRHFCRKHSLTDTAFLRFTCVEHFIDKLMMERPDIEKIAVVTENTDIRTKIMQELREIFELSVSSATWYNIEINAHAATKGNALTALSRLLSIDPDSILAIGDNYNDLSMFEVAGLSAAMANSPKDVQKHALCVTCSNNEDGAAKFIASQLNINIGHFKVT